MRARNKQQCDQGEDKDLECAGKAKRRFLPLPLGEGWGEGFTARTNALTLALSQRERERSKAVSRCACHRTPNRRRTPNVSLKTQNPVTFCRANATGGNGISGNSPGRPEHLSRAFKTAKTFRQVSWLYHRFRLAMIFTVARPRGIHTRFPILLAFMRST